MITYVESNERIDALTKRTAVERVAFERAAGHFLACPVVAKLDSPRRDVSAMDGYAVRESDIENLPARLRVSGVSYPGEPARQNLAPGECHRVFTGAQVPGGADRVVIQEDVLVDGNTVRFVVPAGKGRHIRTQGEDFLAGTTLLPAGSRLDARALVAGAAADRRTVKIHRRPRLFAIGTGDELVPPGKAATSKAAIPQSVTYGVCELARRWGAEVIGHTTLADDLELLRRSARLALHDADIVVVTGGASVGERDHARAMFDTTALEVIFAEVSIKPAKPVWLGQAGKTVVLGLPGNPTSALVAARLFLAPLVVRISGGDPSIARGWRTVLLAGNLPQTGSRETFYRARWHEGQAAPLTDQGSGSQKTLAQADLLLRRPAGSAAAACGEMVYALEF